MIYRRVQSLRIMDLEIIMKMHNLQGRDVHWAVVEEKTANEITSYRPALEVKGSTLYLDLLARRFYSPIALPELKRVVHLARRQDVDDMVAFIAEEDEQKQVVLPSTFLEDAYVPAWYDESLEEGLLI